MLFFLLMELKKKQLVGVNSKELQAIATLNHWGVFFLSSPFILGNESPLELTELLKELIQSSSPRLKLGVTAFFLVRPDQASMVPKVFSLIVGKQAVHLFKCYYTAAVYLQRFWKSQLVVFSRKILPDYFSQELGLPPPNLLHGRFGLVALEELMQKKMKYPYNYQSSFNSLIRILQEGKKVHATTY